MYILILFKKDGGTDEDWYPYLDEAKHKLWTADTDIYSGGEIRDVNDCYRVVDAW